MNESDLQLDEKIRSAMADVPIPSHSLARARNRLRDAALESPALESPAQESSVLENAEQSHDAPAEAAPVIEAGNSVRQATIRSSGRRSWRRAASLAAAACLAIICLRIVWPGDVLSRDNLAQHAVDVVEQLNAAPVEWNENLKRWPAESLRQLDAAAQIQLISQATLDDSSLGLAKNATLRIWKLRSNNTQAELYWIHAPNLPAIQGLGSMMQPLTDSGPWSVAAMQINGQVYMVVCQGDVRNYIAPAVFT